MAVTCKLRNGNKINIYFNYKNVIVGGTHEVRTGLGVVRGEGGGGYQKAYQNVCGEDLSDQNAPTFHHFFR